MALPLVNALAGALDPVERERPSVPDQWKTLRPAAVLVLLFPRGDDVRFLLTVRRETLTHHPGQVSLPGGRLDAGDPSGWSAALREAREEVGMRTGRVRPVGKLDPVPTVVSNHLIVPYVGWSPVAPRLHPSPQEVAEVLDVPVFELLQPENVREEVWELRGRPCVVTYYWLAGHKVWGATGRILSNMAQRLGAVLGPFPPGAVRPAPESKIVGA